MEAPAANVKVGLMALSVSPPDGHDRIFTLHSVPSDQPARPLLHHRMRGTLSSGRSNHSACTVAAMMRRSLHRLACSA